MEQHNFTTHQKVESLTANPEEVEQFADQPLTFKEFSEAFEEFVNEYIHNEKLARRSLSDAKIRAMLYDRTSQYHLWARHIKTWRDVGIFLSLWVDDQQAN